VPAPWGAELDGGHRDRDQRLVDVHRVGVDDPPVGDDVLVAGLVGVDRAAPGTPAAELAPADPEVELELVGAHSSGLANQRALAAGSAQAANTRVGAAS
jgi:hypothetical protein